MTIVRMAEERGKKDAERDVGYQERQWTRLEQSQKSLTQAYNRKVDEALLGLALERIAKQPEADRTPAFKEVLALGGGNAKDTSPESLKKVVAKLYESTTLGDEKARLDLFKSGTTASLKASKDPLIQLALKLRPLQKAKHERQEAYDGRMALLKPKMCILDETDSGLDIDALQVVAKGVNVLREAGRSMLVITHYQRLLNHIVPDVVHVFSDGRVVESGPKELALELEAKGYAEFDEAVA